jgi:DNA-binding response OmpR family regulator
MTSTPPPTPSHSHSASNPPRIAVVEDDCDLRELTVEFLQDKGYTAWGFESAEAFYRHLATHPVDVVVLDIGLPGEDGLSVARHVRTLPHIRIIIVSARVSEADRRAGLLAGAERYLIKPIILDELAHSIEAELACAAIGRDRPAQNAVVVDVWLLEEESWRLTAPGCQNMVLTAREFALLRCLMAACTKTVTQDTVAASVYSARLPSRHERLDVLLSRLRKKCHDRLGLVLPVKTVHLVGYVFTAAARLEQG